MTQAIKNFADGVRRGLGIVVRCHCGKHVTFRAADLQGYVAPGEDIEDRVWRCSWCGDRAAYVRYIDLASVDREDLSSWAPADSRSMPVMRGKPSG